MAANRHLYDDRRVEVLETIRLLRQERQMSLASIAASLISCSTRVGRHSGARVGRHSGVTIADVCEGAGVATGSFYRHFETKEAIFLAAVHDEGTNG
jgi:DNA-binding transcriptional MerR regulator